jgi:ParB family transcriptional regulator, chromosome partitioning protein
MSKTRKGSLGRGLEAILQSPDTDITSKDISGNYVVGAIANIAIEKIEANPFQPRNRFEEGALMELADSVSEQGIIQPLTVRKLGYDKYQIISGERRLRAAKLAGITEVPCYIRVANDEEMLELALIENIHREDLNPIEIGISYQRLMEECKLTQEELSKRVAKQRSTIANYMRLLKLPAEVQVAIRDNIITMGHARSFISLENRDDQLSLLAEIRNKELSVRDVEQKVKDIRRVKIKKRKAPLPEKYLSLAKTLTTELATEVQLQKGNKGKGTIVISFKSDEELERIVTLLSK